MGWDRSNAVRVVITIALMAALAGCAGSSDPEPTSGATPGPQSTPQQAASPTPEDPRVLGFPAQRLPSGLNRTAPDEDATQVGFKVPRGWWGEQGSPTGWVLFWGPDPGESRASLWVDELDKKFEKAVAGFKRVKNLSVPPPMAMDINGRRTLLFAAEVTKGDHALLDEALGVAIDVVGWVETRQIFVDLGRNSMIVRIELPKGERYLPQALKVIRSFRFHP